MNVAVLSLTRDRLEYTQHCFATLQENAGCEFDHYVWDNGSHDGTPEWLHGQWLDDADKPVGMRWPVCFPGNVGISYALNNLLKDRVLRGDYDVIVKFDNDCELTTPNTLRDVCELALETPAILSPRINGLQHPPQEIGYCDGISVRPVIGGIFMAVPAVVFTEYGYRHDEVNNPKWAGDDYNLCRWWQERGGIVGYVDGYEAWHYETTDGQHARFPAYFSRTLAEGKPTL